MLPLEGLIEFLRQLDVQGWASQIGGLASLLACYVLLLWGARRIGRRNIADLEDKNAPLRKQVDDSNTKRRELRETEAKLQTAVENLQALGAEERLARAAKERKDGNKELAIELYQETLATFGPDLKRCCDALAAGDGPEAERYRGLAARLAGIGAEP